MEIPKTAFAPADPGEPSFLTLLPPEIRNRIYEILFKRDGHVLLHDPSAVYRSEPKKSEHAFDGTYYDWVYSYRLHCDKLIIKGGEFRHDFHQSISLMRVCRQIYHEAADILYGHNTFMFSRIEGHISGHTDYSQLMHAGRWLSRLGSQIVLLQSVVVDVDTMCLGSCRCDAEFDLLPLTRLIWASSDLRGVIEFGCSGRAKLSRVQTNLLPIRLTETLNNVLTALAITDVLDTKRYDFSNRLLDSIIISPFENIGQVVFHQDLNHNEMPCMEFALSDEGSTLTPTPAGKQRLERLPPIILTKILEYAWTSSDEITFDLDRHAASGLHLNLLQVCASMRKALSLSGRITQRHSVVIQTTSTEPVTNFNEFTKLRDLIYTDVDWIPHEYSAEVFSHLVLVSPHQDSKPLELLLHFSLDHPASLSELRINLREAMILLCYPSLHPKAMLRVTLEYQLGTRTHRQESIFSVAKLQRKLFLFLSEFLSQTPSCAKFPSGTENDLIHPLPNLWVDGHGNIVAASCYGQSCETEHTGRSGLKLNEWSTVELQIQGYEWASTFTGETSISKQQMMGTNYGVWNDELSKQFVPVWCALRSCHWKDWPQKNPTDTLLELH
ncbi:hypothetical protein T440DRAFT_311174 [Plenodomus tracheiphilus IPT5]|uniref:DUF7730 domain-containing protein n=1 Tax=Plenodomus tracheiphilus IPT5 TaxID=1408161 RepID=A0A6A7BGT5_9PLEO|nr:hypothetical protein T440DRAFT_311174 [Plenodomus tracheiphilus IPT5]